MKKRIYSIFLAFSLLFSSCNQQEDVVSTSSTSYVVLNETTNQIIEGSQYHVSRSVASISKIMTAIIVIENCDLQEIVTVSEEILKVDGSSIYLKVGQKISVLDLLYGLLLQSGNDAAIVLAITTSVEIADFVSLMNEKANNLNMQDSCFHNPHGLDGEDGGNISSAYDMAILYSYCLKNPMFQTIVSSKNYKQFKNKNRLLQRYEYCTGGKTGYTTNAKRTLVTSAFKDGMSLIIVTLNCGNDFESHQNTYEFYFSHYKAIQALAKGKYEIEGKIIYIPHDYTFITKEENVSLFYHIDVKSNVFQIQLLSSNYNCLDTLNIKL